MQGKKLTIKSEGAFCKRLQLGDLNLLDADQIQVTGYQLTHKAGEAPRFAITLAGLMGIDCEEEVTPVIKDGNGRVYQLIPEDLLDPRPARTLIVEGDNWSLATIASGGAGFTVFRSPDIWKRLKSLSDTRRDFPMVVKDPSKHEGKAVYFKARLTEIRAEGDRISFDVTPVGAVTCLDSKGREPEDKL